LPNPCIFMKVRPEEIGLSCMAGDIRAQSTFFQRNNAKPTPTT
jgi:hypothetical protein